MSLPLVEESNPDIIIGEPVGSCTDLSAAVLQPIKDTLANQFDLAPFTVLIDANRLHSALDSRTLSALHPSARYILRKQLEEADIIVLNKAEKVPAVELQMLVDELREGFFEIAHMKMLSVSATNETLSANVTNSKATLRGQIYGDWPMTLILNARVQISPEELLTAVNKQLGAVCRETIESQIAFIQSLSPGRPQPLHRYASLRPRPVTPVAGSPHF